jgi:L-amino acid N-acyltransferase YncA
MRTVRRLRNHRRIANEVRTLVHTLLFGHWAYPNATIASMKYPIKRDATGMRAEYKRSDFGEMERGKYVALARAALMQNTVTEPLTIRPAVDADIEGMRTLLNEIIRVGGTTAITNELSPDEMREWFISGEAVVSCFVAVDSDGAIVGFQSLSKYDSLPAGWVDIATFASRSRHKSGVGNALFARTREAASKLGFAAINATIRVDNVGGLAYYSRMGFTTYLVEEGDPQAQGRVFNRVHKRFELVHST